MKIRLPFFTLACVVLAFAPLDSQAQSGGGDPLVEAREAKVWLSRIQEAANRRNFHGTVVVSAGGTIASSRIAHFCEGKDQFERIDSLDGQMRHVFRHNDVVHTVWPQSRVAMVEQREDVSSFPALQQRGADRIPEFYEFKQVAGTERVAGREAQVLMLRPKDAHRYGYRLWIDQASGLLLRTEVLNDRNDVLESSAFSDVSIGVKPQLDLVLQPVKKLEGYRVLRPTLVPAKLEAEGWSLKSVVPGFKMVSCTKRPFEGPLSPQQNSSAQMLQTIYSDGLTYVSIFIEPYNAERHSRPMAAAIGATQTLMQRQGDWWVTVMGDVPAATLRQFSHALERKK
jgi:sigma-E factor negative regulatory protein RseB